MSNLIRDAAAADILFIFTAQGAAGPGASADEVPGGLVTVLVNPLDETEVQAHCLANGCREDDIAPRATLVLHETQGHPKLVQVKIRELIEQGWPTPRMEEFATKSVAVASAQKVARRLVRHQLAEPVPRFLYTAALATFSLPRATLLRLGELISGMPAPGDVVDDLRGKWLEEEPSGYFRVTPLLKDAGADAWSPEQLKAAHLLVHDAIRAGTPLSPTEAAAMLFHAQLAGDDRRKFDIAARLEAMDNAEAQSAACRHLLWLPYLALENGQQLAKLPALSVILRALQFRVANALDLRSIDKVAIRWREEIELIPQTDLKSVSRQHRWGAMLVCSSKILPIEFRLEAAQGLGELSSEEIALGGDSLGAAFRASLAETGVPTDATPFEFALVMCSAFMRSKDALTGLVVARSARQSRLRRRTGAGHGMGLCSDPRRVRAVGLVGRACGDHRLGRLARSSRESSHCCDAQGDAVFWTRNCQSEVPDSRRAIGPLR